MTLASPVLAQSSADSGAPAPDDKQNDIVVTAQKLDKARDSIAPSIGANTYRLTRSALDNQPGGADRALNSVLLQAPGVSQDSANDGEVHIRNEHGNIQYRLNGVTVPDSIAGFGPLVDTRIAKSVEVLTGALPAQYGYRTAAVVQLTTGSGAAEANGDIDIYGGANGTIQPSFNFANSAGRLNYFVSGSYLRSDLGIADPTSATRAIHDRTEQYRGFAYLSYLIDDKSRVSAFGGTSIGSFQIPNQPGLQPTYQLNGLNSFDSAKLDQNQRQQSHFGVLAYQFAGDKLDFQVAPFIRWAKARFVPDAKGGELLFNGVDTDQTETNLATGIQADASYKLGDSHTLRFGLYFQHEHDRVDSTTRVFTVDPSLNPGDIGYQLSTIPQGIVVNVSASAQTFGAYVQDEWKLADTLTLNYGLRIDRFRWQLTETQLSPRIGLVWKPNGATTIHAAYARNFTPPPLALIGVGALVAFKNTTGAAEVLTADPVRTEREHLFDLGAQQKFGRHLTLGIDAYYKIKRNLLDETQFGSTELLAPFNYARSNTWGVEFSATYESDPLELYLNLARGQQTGQQITSNQFFFSQSDLDYIARNAIFTDHSQKWSVSAGGALKIEDALGTFEPSFEVIYGSGLRKTLSTPGAIPNGASEPGYVQVNLGLSQAIGADKEHQWTLRLDVTNLFDRVYLERDGSGVGAGQPQYGPRRALSFGVKRSF